MYGRVRGNVAVGCWLFGLADNFDKPSAVSQYYMVLKYHGTPSTMVPGTMVLEYYC